MYGQWKVGCRRGCAVAFASRNSRKYAGVGATLYGNLGKGDVVAHRGADGETGSTVVEQQGAVYAEAGVVECFGSKDLGQRFELTGECALGGSVDLSGLGTSLILPRTVARRGQLR